MPESVAQQAEDPEIRSERDYLAAARRALLAMRQDVLDTETPEHVSADSDEVWFNTMYRLARMRRAQDLVDLADVPLFFGRLDYEPGAAYGAEAAGDVDRVYIGRRHVRDAAGTPMVVDWRAPVSMPFYRATRSDRQGVLLRRRYGFSDAAALTAYEDEPLAGPATAGAAPGDAILLAEIERPRSGPMRDIVATIQPEQDELVRAGLHPTLCIQGAPGTGKTAVGLHRLAYLLYAEHERLSAGVAVVGPNHSFLSYIRRVLPALGEVSVTQTTIEELIGRPAARADDREVAALKGDARMAAVLERALWAHVTEPTDGLVYIRGSYRYRLPDHAVARTVTALRGTTRYGAGREALAQRLAHLVLRQMERRGAAPDDRDQRTVAHSRPVKEVVEAAWPKLAPEQVLYRLLSDPAFLAEAAGGELTADEQAALAWPKPYRSWRSAKWSAADAVLLDELADLIDRPASLAHLVVDEAQDLTPMQCRALGRRCPTGSLTVLGDIAQATAPGAVADWPTLLAHLGKPDARLSELDRGFRVPAQIIDYAAHLLPRIAPGLARPVSARQAAGALRITGTSEPNLPDALVLACREALRGAGSVGLIAADADIAGISRRLRTEGLDCGLLGADDDAMDTARLLCVPATLAKGLEFDAVIVVEPARIGAAEPRGLHRLYVVLTRAVSSLHIVHAQPLPDPLPGTVG
jgi:DNA helicase IV